MSQSTIIPNQFTWSQNETTIQILFNIDYFTFAWQASTCKGPCPPMDGTRITVQIQKNQFEINSYQFSLPIFEGKFKKLILPDESTWAYLPTKGIELTLVKREEGILWESPFEWYEKEAYFKIYKIVNSIEVMDKTPEIIILRLQMGEENFEKNKMKFFHDMNRPYERAFEYIRNGCKLNHLIKLQNDFTKCINKKFMNKDGARYVENFMQIKWSAFSVSNLKYMTPMFLSNLKFQVNLGSYVLVKAVTSSQIIFEKHELIVSDSKKQGVKLTILNLSQDIIIQEGTWMMIKEPFLHFSICHITAITVDNLDDIIFQADKKMFEREQVKFPQNLNGDTKKRVLEIENQQVKGLIFSSDLKRLTMTFMAFEWSVQKLTDMNNIIFVEREHEWVGAVIKQEEQIGDNCYEIMFVDSVKSELFIECVKSLTDKNPGNTLRLWRPSSFDLESIAQFLVYKSEVSFEGVKHFAQESLKLKSTDEVLEFWKDKKEKIIKKVGLYQQKERPKKDKKKNKNKIAIKHNQEAVSRQIEEILAAYAQIKANGRIHPYAKQTDKEQIIFQSQDIKNSNQRNLSVDLFDSQNMVMHLVSEPDKNIAETALIYLEEYGKMLKSGGIIKSKVEFSKEILENKVKSEGQEFDLRKTTRALELIELPVSSNIVFSIQRAQELKLRELKMKTQKQEIEKAVIEGEDDPLFFCEFKEMEEIFSEFGDEAFNEMKSMFGKDIYHEELKDEENEIIKIGDLKEEFQELKSEGNGEKSSEIQEKQIVKDKKQILIEKKNVPRRINILDFEEENEQNQENIGIKNNKISGNHNQSNTTKQLVNFESSNLAYEQIIFKQPSSKKSQKTNSICGGKRVVLQKIETNNEDSEFIYPCVKKQSANSRNNQVDLFSDTFTVRSRESHQIKNNHWETRLLNRFGMNASSAQIKKYILEQVKQVLNDEESTLTQSVKHADRYLLIDPSTEMHFVLKQSKSAKTNKTVYIPITVLSKGMKFS